MDKQSYLRAIYQLLEKKVKLFGNGKNFDRDELIAITEMLGNKNVDLKDLKIALDNTLLNKDFFTIASLMEHLPKKQLDISIIECLRQAISYKGLSNSVIYTEGKNYGKTCRQASMEKMIELAGNAGGVIFREYADDFARSEPGSDNQQFRIKRINEYWEDIQHNLELNPNLLDYKFDKPAIEVSNEIKKILGG